AIDFPSGDQRGVDSFASPIVSRFDSPPAAGTIHNREIVCARSGVVSLTTYTTFDPSGEICPSLTSLRAERSVGKKPRCVCPDVIETIIKTKAIIEKRYLSIGYSASNITNAIA